MSSHFERTAIRTGVLQKPRSLMLSRADGDPELPIYKAYPILTAFFFS